MFKKVHKWSGNFTPSKNTNTKKVNEKNNKINRRDCSKCGPVHMVGFMVSFIGYYGCGKSRHVVRHSLYMKKIDKTDAHPLLNPNVTVEPPKWYRFYTLKDKEEK